MNLEAKIGDQRAVWMKAKAALADRVRERDEAVNLHEKNIERAQTRVEEEYKKLNAMISEGALTLQKFALETNGEGGDEKPADAPQPSAEPKPHDPPPAEKQREPWDIEQHKPFGGPTTREKPGEVGAN